MKTQAEPGVTAVLLMIESTVWIAYIDQFPEINAEGCSAHEAFRRVMSMLQQSPESDQHFCPATVNRVKLVKPALPF